MAHLIYPELSYTICGLLFYVHNKLGRFSKEKNYADALELLFKENSILYKREYVAATDIVSRKLNLYRFDFFVDDKILIEIKAKNVLTKDDYYQVKKYLTVQNLHLGLLVNFRDKYLKPQRIVHKLVD
jgi:GxxExxY protein